MTVGIRLVYGGGAPELAVLMFNIANAGERPVHVNGIGWRTGWLRWGPQFLSRRAAVQLTGVPQLGNVAPPFEIQPGAAAATYALMENVLSYARERAAEPFYSRDWPLLGRKLTRVRAYAYTADGHTVTVKPEKSLLLDLGRAESEALEAPEQ